MHRHKHNLHETMRKNENKTSYERVLLKKYICAKYFIIKYLDKEMKIIKTFSNFNLDKKQKTTNFSLLNQSPIFLNLFLTHIKHD